MDRDGGAERTLLAWRRTALAIGVGFAVAARLLLDSLGGLAVVGGLVGMTLAVAGYVAASIRYRRTLRAVEAEAALPAAGGGLALLAGSVTLLGAAALAVVVTQSVP